MSDIEIASVSSDSPEPEPESELEVEPVPQSLYSILSGPITSTISALGAASKTDPSVYELGDDVVGCLKDLKRYWKRDDNDEERTVAKIFAKANVLEKDLVPILVTTADRLPKVAIACADLITSMTWPMDLPTELQELDESGIKGPAADFPLLTRALLSYKAALTRHPSALSALVRLTIPSLARPLKDRTERDKQIVNVVLHAVRNVLAIRDLKGDVNKSGDWGELASLQSTLIQRLRESQFLEVLATLTSNADSPIANMYSSILLEIWYLLFRGVSPARLVIPSAQRPKEELRNLLSVESALKRGKGTTSRHSRFGTAISVTTGKGKEKEKFVLQRPQGITGLPGETMDARKKSVAKKAKMADDLGPEQELSHEALAVLRELAITFLDACFNIFFASLLKDIRYERPHITEADNLRLLIVSSWFVSFFLAARARDDSQPRDNDKEDEKEEEGKEWRVSKVAECCEQEWIVWVVKRMRGAGEEKPKAWVELQACMEALTQLLLLVECMTGSPSEEVREAASSLQHKLWFSSELMDVAFDSAKTYSGQSLAYLDSVVHLNYVLLRLLERYSKGRSAMFVRKRTRKNGKEEEGVADVPDEEEIGPSYEQRKFEFEAYELRFANEDVTSTLLAYLARYRELSADGTLGTEKIKRVVSLLHRQVVKAKAEGLFFKVSTLELFRHILNDERTLPSDAPYKELIQLVRYTLRQFFKEVEKKPFLLVEAFFPKNRGRWKEYSTWEPTEKEKRVRAAKEDGDERPREVMVTGKRSWSEQLGIAMACLIEDGKRELVDWVREILVLVHAERSAIVAATDIPKEAADDEEMDDDAIRKRDKVPSQEARDKFVDFNIPYEKDGQAEAATKNAHLKLMFRLVKFDPVDEDGDPMKWSCQAYVIPSELEGSIKVIDYFLENPFDAEGKKAASLLRKKPRRRVRLDPSDSEGGVLSDEERPRKRKEKRKKEQQAYKSRETIEDSDIDTDAEDEFFRKEEELRAKSALTVAQGGTTMRSAGVKKRKKAGGEERGKKKRKTATGAEKLDEGLKSTASSDTDTAERSTSRRKSSTPATSPQSVETASARRAQDVMDVDETPVAPRAPPKPRRLVPKPKDPDVLPSEGASSDPATSSQGAAKDFEEPDEEVAPAVTQTRRKKGRVVISDDDD